MFTLKKLDCVFEAHKSQGKKIAKIMSKQTIDLETGFVFDSLKEACLALNLKASSERVKFFEGKQKRLMYL